MSGGQKLGSAGLFLLSWSSHDKAGKVLLLLAYGKRRINKGASIIYMFQGRVQATASERQGKSCYYGGGDLISSPTTYVIHM